jgi:hypothetical protein
VQRVLETAVDHQTIGRHGNFWRNKTRDEFVRAKVFGRSLLVVGNGADSNLVRALRGVAPFDGGELPQMPVGFAPVDEQQIRIIERWIDDGCPVTPVDSGA